MGATLQDATAAIRYFSSNEGSKTHPGKAERIDAVTIGWKKAQAHMESQIKASALEPEQARFFSIRNSSKKNSTGTWEWSAWVDADAVTLASIEEVTWKLHEMIPDSTRNTRNALDKFSVSAKSKGSFLLKAEITFKGDLPAQSLRHQLILK